MCAFLSPEILQAKAEKGLKLCLLAPEGKLTSSFLNRC